MRLSALILIAATLFAAAPPSTYVRVSPRNLRYLELSGGSPYIPIGPNMIAPPGRGTDEAAALAAFDDWLGRLATNGGNYIRVWLSNPFWDVEHEKSGVYDAARAGRIDHMLEMCRRHGIRVKLTIEHFRSVGSEAKP